MNNCDIPKVRLKFRQFLSYYAVNPDIWLLNPTITGDSKKPIYITRFNPEFLRVLRTRMGDCLCGDDETGSLQFAFRKESDGTIQVHVLAYEYGRRGTYLPNVMRLVGKFAKDFNGCVGWEITFSLFGRMQYRLWRRKRKRSSKMEKELQIYRDFLESVQKDVDQQFLKAKTYIDQARDDMKQVFKN